MEPLRSSLLFALLLALASCHCNNDCIRERNAEVEKDQRVFDCRMCKAIEVNVDDNCPLTGYECDAALKMSANVLTSTDHCECAQMKCADANATLMIEKELIPKIHCRNQTWTKTSGNVVESAVCARKCETCAINKIGGVFENDNRLIPFTSVAPDANRACANGQCPNGAFVSNEGEVPVVKPASMWFSCRGDGSWKSMSGSNPTGQSYRRIQCIKQECAPLPPAACDNTKYSCQTPQEMSLSNPILPPGLQKVLGCTNNHKLRSTNLLEPMSEVSCLLGVWFKGTSEISDSTPVSCITCKKPQMNAPLPVSNGEGDLYCDGGKLLTFTWQHPQDDWITTTGTLSARLFCTDQFTWDSEGVTFGHGVNSLADLVAGSMWWSIECIVPT